MTWTYTAVATPKDQVRLLIGDTDSADPQLADEEIAFYLASYPNPYRAGALAAEALAAKYSRKVDYDTGREMRQMLAQRAKAYRDLAGDLRGQAARRGIKPYAGAITRSDKALDRTNEDLVRSPFQVDMQREAGTEETDVEGVDPQTVYGEI